MTESAICEESDMQDASEQFAVSAAWARLSSGKVDNHGIWLSLRASPHRLMSPA
ncbi:hypothetical protein AvCA_07220 [Azotobacter vinelandii CA]|uniref:Uncharacterized protein n=2 Tax=Azotobacter vinelandii TaxID=354 RepID=C1DLM0_AZOVD|nr:hypothetical protein Avin_07220 [Azotobacter vinelandii DJ]AGK15531.1 hypothetical protein AvCA_07220 [Azotobacter vinelandii CA]AGK19472.1 hypothetical protein AvCA6_07220 [Azotobacter vinelandii CA6]